MDHYKTQNYCLASDTLWNQFQQYWQLILNHKDFEADAMIEAMSSRVLTYADKMWDRILHVSEQNDWVDMGQASMIEDHLNQQDVPIKTETENKRTIDIKGDLKD